jgi:hypothetical protein
MATKKVSAEAAVVGATNEAPAEIVNFRKGVYVGKECKYTIRYMGGKTPGFAAHEVVAEGEEGKWSRHIARKDGESWDRCFDRLMACVGRHYSEENDVPHKKLNFSLGDAPERKSSPFSVRPFENQALLDKLNPFRKKSGGK